MTPEQLAALHARSIQTPRPWTASEFETLLAQPATFLVADAAGFALGRVIADEAELLTIVVAPGRRGEGVGGRLLTRFQDRAAETGARRAFLEVAEDNRAAIALYRRAGWAELARRDAYYARPDGKRVAALVMEKALARQGRE